jgi:hypothetical protein
MSRYDKLNGGGRKMETIMIAGVVAGALAATATHMIAAGL